MDIPEGFAAVATDQETLVYQEEWLEERETERSVLHLFISLWATFPRMPVCVSVTLCWWWEGLVLR